MVEEEKKQEEPKAEEPKAEEPKAEESSSNLSDAGKQILESVKSMSVLELSEPKQN